MELFNVASFVGGLDGELNRLYTPDNAYPLLINGRPRTGVVEPVRAHRELTGFPAGTLQELNIVGNLLVLFVSGNLWYKDLAVDGPWQRLTSWSTLSPVVDELYSELIPVTSNFFNRTGTPDSSVTEFNPLINPSPAGLLVTDGVNQPRVVSTSGGVTVAGTYETWTRDNPSYIPLGIIPRATGSKLWLVAPDRRRVFQSVSGRLTDFMVNLTSAGLPGGRADTMQVAVDANELTNIIPTQDGGFIASTLHASYVVQPDFNNLLFGEYRLQSLPLFPVGAVNHKSNADIGGDTAFISQMGIQAFNLTAQTKRESNNFPMGAKISRYLVQPQTETCAINFNDYALFAVNTTFGRAVAVYDTIRQQFVSFDTGFGTVKKFAVYRANGVQRLFFINTDNRLYEAYASPQTAIARILLGDFSSREPRKLHKVHKVAAAFTQVNGNVSTAMQYMADGRRVEATAATFRGGALQVPAPAVQPFVQDTDTVVVAVAPAAPQLCLKSSVWLAWQGQAALAGLSIDGSVQPEGDLLATTVVDKQQPTKVAVMGSLPANSALPQLVRISQAPQALITLGNVTPTAGTESDYAAFAATVTNIPTTGAAGNIELDTNSGRAWFNRNERFFKHTVGHIDFFVLNPGWNSANDTVDANGNAGTSIAPTSLADQLVWLAAEIAASTNTYKIVVTAFPPFSETLTDSPGYAALRADYRAMGANLLLAGHSLAYMRYYKSGFPYIVLSSGATEGFVTGNTQTVFRTSTTGYLLLEATAFELQVQFRDTTGTLRDATTIYPA